MEVEHRKKSLSNECMYNGSLWSSLQAMQFLIQNRVIFLILPNVELNTILVTVKEIEHFIHFYCD